MRICNRKLTEVFFLFQILFVSLSLGIPYCLGTLDRLGRLSRDFESVIRIFSRLYTRLYRPYYKQINKGLSRPYPIPVPMSTPFGRYPQAGISPLTNGYFQGGFQHFGNEVDVPTHGSYRDFLGIYK